MRKYTVCILLSLLLLSSIARADTGFTSNIQAINDAANSVMRLNTYWEEMDTGTASGFLALNDHTLVTCYHVLEDTDAIIAYSDNEETYTIDKVYWADEATDIAILGFSAPTGLPTVTFNTEEVLRAEPIIVISSPLGFLNNVSSGIVSSLFIEEDVSYIMFTAPISGGSSGGPLFNDRGEVIGIASASYHDYDFPQNLNLAVDASEILKALSEMNEEYAVSLEAFEKGARPGIAIEPAITDVSVQQRLNGSYQVRWYDTDFEETSYIIAVYNMHSDTCEQYPVTTAPGDKGLVTVAITPSLFVGDEYLIAIGRDSESLEAILQDPENSESTCLFSVSPSDIKYRLKYSTLRVGDTGDAVEALQQKLIDLGYLNGSADGIFGQQTATAVRDFATRNNLDVTDSATVEIQALLFEGNPDRYKISNG